jgi:hypothetical protein
MTFLQRAMPRGKIELEMGSVAIFVGVFELIERRILGIEQLSVAPEELLAVTVGLGHRTSSLVRRLGASGQGTRVLMGPLTSVVPSLRTPR